MKKIKDIAAKTGSYTVNGETKGRWKNVGGLMQDDKGGQFIMLDRSFNPAGIPFKEGGDSILLSLFDPKDSKQSSPTAHDTAKANAYQPQPDDGENIPF